MLTKEEIQFERALLALRTDVDHACQFYVIHNTIHESMRLDRRIEIAINEHVRFWNYTLNGLTGGLFTSLGRIFDSNGGHGIPRLINFAEKHCEKFTPESLRRRKEHHGVEGDALERYMESKIDLSTTHLRDVRMTAERFKGMYERACGPVRNKVIAHTVLTEREDQQKLFKNLDDNEIACLLFFLKEMSKALFMLFDNGLEMQIAEYVIDIQNEHNSTQYSPLPIDSWDLGQQTMDFMKRKILTGP
jgi:hypothetical protein